MKFSMTLTILLLFVSFSLEGASVTFSIGNVEMRQNNEWKPLQTGPLPVEAKEIRTGTNSLAIISLGDDITIKLKEKTRVALTSLNNKKISLFLNSGGLFSRIKKRSIEEYTIRTATATAAVRGTQFFMAYGKQQRKGQDIWLCVNEGKVAVTGSSRGKQVEVTEGLGVFIDTAGTVTSPRRYSWTENLNWNIDPAKGPVKDTTNLKKAYHDLLDQDYD